MATYIKTLKDGDSNTIYPQTKSDAIFMGDNRSLEVALTKRIVLSDVTPTEQIAGDLWYKEITE